MQTQTEHTAKKGGIFFPLLFLTTFFLLLEISFFIQCNKIYFADFTVVANQLNIPASVLPGVAYFIFAQLLVHLGYAVWIWILVSLIAKLFQLSIHKKIQLSFFLWLLGIFTLLIANQLFYPNSKFSELTASILFDETFTKILFDSLLTLCSICIFLALLGLIRFIFLFKHRFLFISIGTVMLLLLLSVQAFKPIPSTQDASTKERPNIILIGIDSLRPDFLSFFGHEKSTPFFDQWLAQSSVFAEAVTPLARTFPAWTSVLMGQYPKTTGIRSDLAKQNKINLADLLPVILKHKGYETIFATDETRFSNIDQQYGFDQVVTPPIGLNDFLLGTFNDFPLSNFLINTKIGQWLFPYSYANRPVYFTYDPDSFLNLLQPALTRKRTQPVFLAVHFCLPHTPYLWAGLRAENLNAIERYEATINRMDKQLQDFFALLQQTQLLTHAVVVVLSDHGEALALSGDRITDQALFQNKNIPVPKFYPPMLDNEEVNQSAGHGTDVLGLPQYHSLLAFKLYGLGKQQQKVLTGVVSLLDIKPTVLQLLNIPDTSSQGKSLVAWIRDKNPVTLPRHIFLESDFTPEAIRTVYPETRKVVLEGVHLFEIDPLSTRLTVRETMSKMIVDSKQYADIYGEWILALYPQNNHYRMPILVNLVSGEWTNDLHSSLALQSPASEMLKALKKHMTIETIN